MLLLGIGDTIAALLLVRGFYDIFIPTVIVSIFAGYLIIKGIIFIADIGSIMDIAVGILLFLTIATTIHFSILLIFAVIVGIKGIMTIFAGIRY